ncbi:ribonuclease H-like domain-containing protein [Chloroflexota bacterium]
MNDRMLDAYLDIETTGLSYGSAGITVVGIYLVNGVDSKLVQLVGEEVTINNLLETLGNANIIYTYNGSRFDLPFINTSLGTDLTNKYHHHDLMYDCWRCNLKGGLKSVEQQLGIPRQLHGIGGFEAIMLWRRYRIHNDRNALNTLLEYNKEDVVNLKVLRGILTANFNGQEAH